MLRIQNVFIPLFLASALLSLAGCQRCVVQGPWCNKTFLNQTMVDMDINNNPYYMTSFQRRAACLTLASNVAPTVKSYVSTNWTITNVNGLWITNTAVVTNVSTNSIMLPYDMTDIVSGKLTRDNTPTAFDYGQNCTVLWQ